MALGAERRLKRTVFGILEHRITTRNNNTPRFGHGY